MCEKHSKKEKKLICKDCSCVMNSEWFELANMTDVCVSCGSENLEEVRQ